MRYEGEPSRCAIQMLIRVYQALRELNLKPVWREAGVVCLFEVPRGGKTFLVRRLFFPEPGRLIQTASLYDDPAAMVAVHSQPLARHAEIYDTLTGDVTPRLVGRLLDNSTAALLKLAGEPSVATSATT